MIETYLFYNPYIEEWMTIPWYRGTNTIDYGAGDLLVWLLDAEGSEDCRLNTMREF